MKSSFLFFPVLLVGCFWSLLANAKEDHPSQLLSSNQQLCFIENKGQVTDQYGQPRNDIDFRLVGKGVSMFVGSGQIHYQWATTPANASEDFSSTLEMYRMDVTLEGAYDGEIIVEKSGEYYERYYINNVRKEGVTVYSYQKITYKNVYPYIDWVLYQNDGSVKYDFIVHPGGNVTDIKIKYGGANSILKHDDGSLIAHTPLGYIEEQKPVCYQSNGKKIESSFKLSNSTVSFDIEDYDGTLIIDPAVDWGTLFGGLLNDKPNHVAIDDSGYIYMVGSTASISNIATTGAYQTSYGGGTGNAAYLGEAYLSKFNSLGQCLWSTYYGGAGADQAHSVAIDTAGHLYIAGFTNSSSGIATTGSYQSTIAGGYDAFLAKFNVSGQRLWATYYGGTSNENQARVYVTSDTVGNVYLSGSTNSNNGIATTGSFQSSIGGSTDAFLAKFTEAGVRVWGTYFGGSGADIASQTVCSKNGNIFINGRTASTAGIATTGTHQQTNAGSNDAYLAKFSDAGLRLWGTYFGGNQTDIGVSLFADDYDNIYQLGVTASTSDIATTNAHQTVFGGTGDLYLTKYNNNGQRIWSTYYGGSDDDFTNSPTLSNDIIGNIYIAGGTRSTNGIASTAGMQNTITSVGLYDAFFAKFDTAGTRLWGTYYGSVDDDAINALASDSIGNVYMAGETTGGSGIATSGAYQTTYGGGLYDGFLIKIIDCDTPSQPGAIVGPVSVCKGGSYTYSVPSMIGVTSYSWTLPSGWQGTSTTNIITVMPNDTAGVISVVGNTPCVNGPAQNLAVSISLIAVIGPTGSISFCASDSILLSANTGANYNWQWLKDGLPIPGSTTDTLLVHQAGTYAVIISDGVCTDTSKTDTVNIYPLPLPTVTLNGNDLSTENYFVSYQWNYGGTAITGAISDVYTASLDGYYSVTVIDTNGCTATSPIFIKGFPANIDKTNNENRIKIYPNPTTALINIEVGMHINIELTSVDGRRIGLFNGSKVIDLGELPTGLYILTCKDTWGKIIQRTKITKY